MRGWGGETQRQRCNKAGEEEGLGRSGEQKALELLRGLMNWRHRERGHCGPFGEITTGTSS